MTVPRTLTTRGAARHARLLDAAVSVVACGGSATLTHRAVAATAEVSLASVTYHFASIEELRRATFERALAALQTELADAVRRVGGTMERMPAVFADYTQTLLTKRRDAVSTVNEMIVAASHDDHLRATFHAYQDELAGMLDPCVGGRDAGLMVAASLQGLIVSALTYPGTATSAGAAEWRDAAVELINQVRLH